MKFIQNTTFGIKYRRFTWPVTQPENIFRRREEHNLYIYYVDETFIMEHGPMNEKVVNNKKYLH